MRPRSAVARAGTRPAAVGLDRRQAGTGQSPQVAKSHHRALSVFRRTRHPSGQVRPMRLALPEASAQRVELRVLGRLRRGELGRTVRILRRHLLVGRAPGSPDARPGAPRRPCARSGPRAWRAAPIVTGCRTRPPSSSAGRPRSGSGIAAVAPTRASSSSRRHGRRRRATRARPARAHARRSPPSARDRSRIAACTRRTAPSSPRPACRSRNE